jgi:hypothetical protein
MEKPLTLDQGRQSVLKYLRYESCRIVMVGPVASWLRGRFSLRRTEELLDRLVAEGVLRPATDAELQTYSLQHGYVVISLPTDG